MNYYEVSPTKIVRQDAGVLTYCSEQPLEIGAIVKIPVGRQTLVGIVMRQVKKPKYAVKNTLETVTHNALPPSLVRLALWLSDYYVTHLATVWQTILPTGITKKRRQKTLDQPHKHYRNRTKNVFTKDQSEALKIIHSTASGTILLHGVTGAGKTLIYIKAAKKALAENKSVIIIVPEIALTSQLVAEFEQYFDNIILTHSRQTEAERHLSWQEILSSTTPNIVIGPRSALFMPLKSIGLIVIDECHEPSLKQEQAPKYSALRVASILTNLHQAKLILGSATPSVLDYNLAKNTKRPIVTIGKPARTDSTEPEIKIVDMTKRQNFTKHYFLSDKLIDDLGQTLNRGDQALIFHNRRGTAPTTLCQNCGWQAGCPRCFVPLTLHADRHQLICHICGLTSPVITSCPDCHNAEVIHKGIGTKRIEAELKKLFPKHQIARFDGDTDTDQTADQRYQDLYDGNIDIIIGTQVIAKGLDLPKLRFVGIVQADAGLSLPDFTAPERTFQLLAQVIGRVGRSKHATKVILQSYQPQHPAIQDAIARDYFNFYNRTIKQRQKANFPPFCYLLKLTCVYKTEKTAIQNTKKLAEILRQKLPKGIQIMGPTPAFYERVRDTYRWQLVIKSKKRQTLIDALEYVPKNNWQFDIDPANLL